MMDYELIHAISEIDREMVKIERETNQNETAKTLNKMRREYNELKQQYETTVNQYENKSSRVKELTDKIDALSKELKEDEDKLYQTSSMKSIEAIQRTINKLQTEIGVNEEEIYNLLNETEALKNSKKEMAKELQAIRLRYNSMKGDYNAHNEKLQAYISELNTKRKDFACQVSQGIMEEYEHIRKSKKYGMSVLKGEICSGCGMGVPYIIISEVRRNKSMTQCPNCGRYIYIEE
jgi:predicted  nucleic acid-binding Zn-ribbon protein